MIAAVDGSSGGGWVGVLHDILCQHFFSVSFLSLTLCLLLRVMRLSFSPLPPVLTAGRVGFPRGPHTYIHTYAGVCITMGGAELTEQKQQEENALKSSYVAYASSGATVVTKTILHPLDTIKCRLQSSGSRKLWHVWHEYSGAWGPSHMYAGLPIKLAFYVPYQALYMTSYTAARGALQPVDVETESRTAFLARTIAAAAAADLTSSVVRVPMETVKMRLQANMVPNTLTALQQIYRQGLFACARLMLPQTFLHDIPYSAIQWILYESLRSWSQEVAQHHGLEAEPDSTSPLRTYTHKFMHTFLTGGFSGFMASTLTVPLDTIRTRVVVATSVNQFATIRSVVRDTYHMGGVRFFFRGAAARVLWVTANTALYFPLYEAFKSELLRMQKVAASPSC